jgi:hypothetical protein
VICALTRLQDDVRETTHKRQARSLNEAVRIGMQLATEHTNLYDRQLSACCIPIRVSVRLPDIK